VLLAKELATLDQLSNGRVIVGVGRGRDDDAVGQLGFPTDKPFGRLAEGVAVMRAAWTQPTADHNGELWSFADMTIEPKPVQQPGPPIWFGAAGPKAIARAAKLADGWIGAGASSAKDLAEQVRMLDAALAGEGRNPQGFGRAKRVYIGVERTASLAAQRLTEALDGLYATPGLTERTGVHGTPEYCAEHLAGLLDAGVNELILTPVYDHLEQLEQLAEVVSLVRAASA
jgi:alkanesulfonate monooxygenase SsuD/methylene tetrahydromethanopterin reductase-like flavin-dependent oxidoreductase (luciferase family)